MFCCRVVVFLFAIIFTAAAVCANIFPLYRSKDSSNSLTKTQYYFQHLTVSIGDAKSTLKYSDKAVNMGCKEIETFWLASFILAIAGAATGGIGMILSFAHLFVRGKCGLCGAISVFFFLAFACFGVCVALPTVMYASDRCTTTVGDLKVSLWTKLKDRNFDMVEGFGLTCAACGGFLILIFIECCS